MGYEHRLFWARCTVLWCTECWALALALEDTLTWRCGEMFTALDPCTLIVCGGSTMWWHTQPGFVWFAVRGQGIALLGGWAAGQGKAGQGRVPACMECTLLAQGGALWSCWELLPNVSAHSAGRGQAVSLWFSDLQGRLALRLSTAVLCISGSFPGEGNGGMG